MDKFLTISTSFFTTKWIAALKVKVRRAFNSRFFSNRVYRQAVNEISCDEGRFTDVLTKCSEDRNSSNEMKYTEKKKSYSPKTTCPAKKMDEVTDSIHAFLTSHFELRYNVLTDQTEYRPPIGRYSV